MAEKKVCFVIAPIGEANTETRRRSDQVLRHIITPAVSECGYDPIRADQISEPGIITSQVIQHVVEDPLVVADLTERNPNVFYELAIRHAIKRPLVQIIRKGEPLPFDVAGTRTIQVDHRDLDSVEEAKNEIIRQVKAVERNASDVDTPISVALDLQTLRQSDNPEQRSLADILSALAEIRTGISSLEKRLGDVEIPKVLIRSVKDDILSPDLPVKYYFHYAADPERGSHLMEPDDINLVARRLKKWLADEKDGPKTKLTKAEPQSKQQERRKGDKENK